MTSENEDKQRMEAFQSLDKDNQSVKQRAWVEQRTGPGNKRRLPHLKDRRLSLQDK